MALLDCLREERRLRLDQLGLLGVIGANLDRKAGIGRLLLGRVVPPLPRRPYRLTRAFVGDQLSVFVGLREVLARAQLLLLLDDLQLYVRLARWGGLGFVLAVRVRKLLLYLVQVFNFLGSVS